MTVLRVIIKNNQCLNKAGLDFRDKKEGSNFIWMLAMIIYSEITNIIIDIYSASYHGMVSGVKLYLIHCFAGFWAEDGCVNTMPLFFSNIAKFNSV